MKAMLLLGSTLIAGCQHQSRIEAEELSPDLARYELAAVPADIEHRTFIDFEGKAMLVGYDLSPKGPVAPGATVDLKLYWRSSKRLGEDWELFTHVLDENGRVIARFDDVGPLRRPAGDAQALGPSKWRPGYIYVDEQSLRIPRRVKVAPGQSRPLRASELTVAVGIRYDDPKLEDSTIRLNVVSGPHDGQQRGLVAYVPTEIKARAEKKRDSKRFDRKKRSKRNSAARLARERSRKAKIERAVRAGRGDKPTIKVADDLAAVRQKAAARKEAQTRNGTTGIADRAKRAEPVAKPAARKPAPAVPAKPQLAEKPASAKPGSGARQPAAPNPNPTEAQPSPRTAKPGAE